MYMRKILSGLAVVFLITACSSSSVLLEPADFAWPIESVLTTDANGNVSIERYSSEFNVTNLFTIEYGDSTIAANKEVRIIRGQDGYYYMTAAGFKNVYLFFAKEGTLILEKKVLVNAEGISEPVFNQRKPYVELIDGEMSYQINSQGLKEVN